MRIDAGRDVGKEELAQILGVGSQVIDNYIRAGCPCKQRGGAGVKYVMNTAAVHQWVREREAAQSAANFDPERGVTEEGKRRHTLASARLKEIELAKTEGSMVHVSAIASLAEEEYAAVRTRLMAMPGRLAQVLAAEDDPSRCEAIIKEEIRQALSELSLDQEEFDASRLAA